MPIIRVKAEHWGQLFGELFKLWLDPESKKKWQITARDLEGHARYAIHKEFPDKSKLSAKDVDLIHSTNPKGTRLPGNYQTNIGEGFIAGAILLTVLRLAQYDPAQASVEKALRIVAMHLKKQGAGSSRAHLMNAWGRYKDLSPYFAVAAYDIKIFKQMGSLIGLALSKKAIAESKDDVLPFNAKTIRPGLKNPKKLVAGYEKIEADVLPRYFAMAERFRELGELHFAPGQRVRKKPLLDNKTLWRIPRGFKFPHVKITFKRLNKAERTAISSVLKSKS